MWVIGRLVPNRQLGSHSLFMFLKSRRERSVQNAAAQQRAFDGRNSAIHPNCLRDRTGASEAEQVGAMGMPRSCCSARGRWARRVLDRCNDEQLALIHMNSGITSSDLVALVTRINAKDPPPRSRQDPGTNTSYQAQLRGSPCLSQRCGRGRRLAVGGPFLEREPGR